MRSPITRLRGRTPPPASPASPAGTIDDQHNPPPKTARTITDQHNPPPEMTRTIDDQHNPPPKTARTIADQQNPPPEDDSNRFCDSPYGPSNRTPTD
jgi:hypothetical protein